MIRVLSLAAAAGLLIAAIVFAATGIGSRHAGAVSNGIAVSSLAH